MAVRSLLWRGIAIIAFAAVLSVPTPAAVVTVSGIHNDNAIPGIGFDGPIEKGDYERLIDAVLMAGVVRGETISLSSPGGGALEAMRLGRLIRLFGLHVDAPKRFTETNASVCPSGIDRRKRQSCSCDSACLFLYLGGIHRFGDSLGVHRLYLDPEAQRKITLDEGKAVALKLEEATRRYFEEMRAPASLLDHVNSAASDSVRYLSEEYVEQNLYGYSRDVEDWLIAKCGSASRASFDRWRRHTDPTDSERAEAVYNKIHGCFDHQLENERLRIFRTALANAIETADPKYITEDSLLDFARRSPDIELADIVGMPIDKAVRALTVFGLGYRDPKSLETDEGYYLAHRVLLAVDSDRTVSSIQIHLFDDGPESHLGPFTGQFLKGFDQNSKPKDFIARYGKPYHQQRLADGGTAGLWLESANYDVWAIFSVPSNKLRAVHINRAGYWRSQSWLRPEHRSIFE